MRTIFLFAIIFTHGRVDTCVKLTIFFTDLKNKNVVLNKQKNVTTIQSSSPHLGIYPKELKSGFEEILVLPY